ncbi:MAG: hypothetical protein IIU48_06950 [Prevotella sp.]|jgi:hypothetical protein|nr:hypothetical protein [Prevotella sp.]MBQ1758086.1 hypothetical protein [Prevotella sp.]MBQ1800417.1 hypothetical protein [Prevotella sp.]MBQ5378241.1 hypothetical protein [Prevotella sp.]MBQ5454385.1 hypothetical protein [Prevotella sp.]
MTISLWLMFTAYIFAEPCDSVKTTSLNDTILQVDDSLFQIEKGSLIDTISFSLVDTLPVKKQKRDWKTWRPNPKKALWLAIVIPGAGQIYNRKYWKLPIVYGGFVGCAYAMRWNNMMYKDYSQAYIDLTDDDPNTKSYERFQQFSNRITDANIKRYQELFKNRKNRFRRWRDLSFFVMCGVYAISIIDAYVDASLSEFDISDDLTMRVAPTIINNKNVAEHNPLKSTAIGLQCSLFF